MTRMIVPIGADGRPLPVEGDAPRQAQPAKGSDMSGRTYTLKEVRVAMLKMTIEHFAELLGEKRSTYYFWENGKRPLPEEVRLKALNILGERGFSNVVIDASGGIPVGAFRRRDRKSTKGNNAGDTAGDE